MIYILEQEKGEILYNLYEANKGCTVKDYCILYSRCKYITAIEYIFSVIRSGDEYIEKMWFSEESKYRVIKLMAKKFILDHFNTILSDKGFTRGFHQLLS